MRPFASQCFLGLKTSSGTRSESLKGSSLETPQWMTPVGDIFFFCMSWFYQYIMRGSQKMKKKGELNTWYALWNNLFLSVLLKVNNFDYLIKRLWTNFSCLGRGYNLSLIREALVTAWPGFWFFIKFLTYNLSLIWEEVLVTAWHKF